ncbi:MAG TPA: TetR/AcrR family transcriptional regulator [Bacilli bacterium]|jgi:AcrR family transcriptional regulator|nr:TetR/AcrR family transcriptional regulator [Acholeplasmataceae bacterium]HNZ78038.1 TetR/AcrR family transcriptional regulator [Bacilli bacterium]HOD61260.1 TetR/AcrR family transcriptional regulator [Bacilli bacterium]HOE06699.1 TetR/AcrR family transcriptional regulator [Bacilli bacterium]HOH61886.1 TetR/AcrR family transcriptional regulator [Bacilli bacterium]
MKKKEDRRVLMTKRMLKDALIEILKKKDIYHISIRELCERADVNRTTFYKYYGSQFDLLTDMEKDILDFISKTIKHNETEPEKIMSSICNYLEENLEFVRLIINNNVDPMFAHKLLAMESIKESALNRFSASKSEAEVEYIYNFLTYGAFHMVCAWLNKEKRESPKMLAKLIVQMMLR